MDFYELIVNANDVGRSILWLYRRQREARGSAKDDSILDNFLQTFGISLTGVRLRALEKLCHDAAEGPHVSGLAILFLGQNDLRRSVPSGKNSVWEASLFILELDFGKLVLQYFGDFRSVELFIFYQFFFVLGLKYLYRLILLNLLRDISRQPKIANFYRAVCINK